MIKDTSGSVMRGPGRARGRWTDGCQWWMALILPVVIAITAGPALGQAKAPERKVKNRGAVTAAKPGNTDPAPTKITTLTPFDGMSS